MKKLRKIKNSCAPVALLYVSGADESTVIRVCKLHGFNEKDGMADSDWKKAATDLAVDFRGVEHQPCSLKKFIIGHPTGLYLLGTYDHIFCLDNGLIVDPKTKHLPGLNRIIKQAWRVDKK